MRKSFEVVREIALMNKQELICAEIGVSTGDNAEAMLEAGPIKKLYLIDDYGKYSHDTAYEKIIPLEDRKTSKDSAFKRFEKYGDKVEWVYLPSVVAIMEFPNDYLDYCYIDANHDYRYVLMDLKSWYSKVKPGGVFAGHDYGGDVAKAVWDFFLGKFITFYNAHADWWIIKPWCHKT